LRKKKRMTQAQVAEMLFISQNSYSLIETGKTRIDIERLQKIAAIFSISVQDILEILPQGKNNDNWKISA
jgi:transcriptional regulator with XRE-family HTH domain